jgi:hypothetical protein
VLDSDKDKRKLSDSLVESIRDGIRRERAFYAYAAARGIYHPIPPPWLSDPSMRDFFDEQFAGQQETEFARRMEEWNEVRGEFDALGK